MEQTLVVSWSLSWSWVFWTTLVPTHYKYRAKWKNSYSTAYIHVPCIRACFNVQLCTKCAVMKGWFCSVEYRVRGGRRRKVLKNWKIVPRTWKSHQNFEGWKENILGEITFRGLWVKELGKEIFRSKCAVMNFPYNMLCHVLACITTCSAMYQRWTILGLYSDVMQRSWISWCPGALSF